MDKIFTTAILAALLVYSTTASADYRHRGNRGHYTQHQHHNRSWVAPLVGGMVLGGMGYYGYQRYYQPQPVCWDEMVGYDRRGREVWQRFCN
jgi:hypothetical protein